MAYLYNPNEDLEKLKILPQFKSPTPEIDAVLKYLIFLYDPDSDLRKTIPRLPERKKEAVKLAEFKTTRTGGLTEFTEGILLGKNKEVNRMIIDFIKLFNNPWLLKYYASWNLMEAEITDTQNLSKKKPKDRDTIRKNIKENTVDIDECESHLFGGKDTEALRSELFATIERDKSQRLRPELMAADLENKEADIGTSPFYPHIQ